MSELLVAVLAIGVGGVLGAWWAYRHLRARPSSVTELEAELERIDARALEDADTLDEPVPPGSMAELLAEIARRNEDREARR